MPNKKTSPQFKRGDRVKINTGSQYIPSVDDYFGTIVAATKDNDVFLVNTDDETLEIHAGRLQKA